MRADDVAAATRPVATYVYCVLRVKEGVSRAPRLGPRHPSGLTGAERPRLLDAGDDYGVLVATVPLSLYSADQIEKNLADLDWLGERATEHEALLEHVMSWGVVVPMTLFTLFRSDERAVAHVRRMKSSLARVVERVAGCEEWNLRIRLDPARAESAARATLDQALAGARVSGTSFLQRKQALDEARRHSRVRSANGASELYERIARNARAARRRTPSTGELAAGLVLDAVFLVPRAWAPELTRTVDAAATPLVDAGFAVALSGPWPAYSFVEQRR
jgi:hypothetical protein